MSTGQLFEDDKRPRKRKRDEIDPKALAIYQAYPLHRARRAAITAIEVALKAVDYDTLMAAVVLWGNSDEVSRYLSAGTPNFIKRCATWMNDECWLDEIPETLKARIARCQKEQDKIRNKREAEERAETIKGDKDRAARRARIAEMSDDEFERRRTEALKRAITNHFLHPVLSRLPARENEMLAYEICKELDLEGER